MRARVTVVGSSNFDYVMTADHLPAVGESVTDCRFFHAYGGKGANQAVAAARAGGVTSFVTAVGAEPGVAEMLATWTDAGIDTSGVARLLDVPTGAALVMVDGAGANYLTIAPGANSCVSPDCVLACEDLFKESDWVLLQMEIPAVTNETVLEIAARHRKPVLFNYAPVRLPPVRMGPAVHGLVVNEKEAVALSRCPFAPDDVAAAKRVASGLRAVGGHRFAIVTLGERGAVVADASGEQHVPGFKVSAVDTTAAGDTFCGALVVALAERQSLLAAATFASAAAALCCTRPGAQASIPLRREIETFLASSPTHPS